MILSVNHYSVVKMQMESENLIYGICTGKVNLMPWQLITALTCLIEGFLSELLLFYQCESVSYSGKKERWIAGDSH